MKDVRVFAGWSCVGLLVVGLAGCAAAPRQRAREGGPVDTGAGTLTSARKFLEGRWSLESFQVFPAGKPPVTIKGQGTVTTTTSATSPWMCAPMRHRSRRCATPASR